MAETQKKEKKRQEYGLNANSLINWDDADIVF